MDDIKVISFVAGTVQSRGDILIPTDAFGQFSDEPEFVSGVAKVNQDVAKGLLTQLGSAYLAPSYGTNLSTLIRTRNLDSIADQLNEEIQSLLGYLANYNADQPAAEQLVELVDLQAIEQGVDTVKVSMTIRTGDGQTTTIIST